MEVKELSLNSNVLSLGALLGSSGSTDLINSINARCGGASFFSTAADPYRDKFANFMQQIVEPIRLVNRTIAGTVNKLFSRDEYRYIQSREDLQHIPPCMHLGIVYYQPVREMLEQERIEGFGIDPSQLQAEDPYKDLCESGRCDIHSTLLDKDGCVDMQWVENTTDPDLSWQEVDMLAETRRYIDEFLKDEETRYYDVTAYPSLHC